MQRVSTFFLIMLCFSSTVFAAKEMSFAVLSLEQATKQIIENDKSKVLGAKTEVINGKDVHVIKILTPDGRVQYLKIDAETGKKTK